VDFQQLALVPAPAPVVTPSPQPRPAWSLGRRIAFRFAFVYFGLYSIPFPLTQLPKVGDKIDKAGDRFWLHIVPWFGKHVLHLAHDITFDDNGSGDTTYNWTLTLVVLLLAIAATAVWSIVDRRRRRYDFAWELLQIYLRYVLATAMARYGSSKLFRVQFPPLTPYRLAEPYGESSPHGILWAFMSASDPYTIFAGAAECVGGALLLFRRTTLLGALILLGVMGNVVLLNFCYDVPVKLYSTHLWLMALVLTLPNWGRLFDLFVLQRATTAATTPSSFTAGRLRWVRWSLKSLLILSIVYVQGYGHWTRAKRYAAAASQQGAMSGQWQVVAAQLDGKPLPHEWRRISISDRALNARQADGEIDGFYLTDDGAKKTLTLTDAIPPAPGEKPRVLTYTRVGDTGTLDGSFEGKKLHVELRAIDTSKSLLTTRGFHWINETSYNR